jgi:UDP-N-acetylmuramate--alanine ligase
MNNTPPDRSLLSFKHIHFIGVGGIGMSSIAQFLCDRIPTVSGSDRAVDNPENTPIISALRKRGIKLYHQDGSFIKDHTPDLIVYSTAIEDDNPDFQAAPDIPKIHRAEMLNLCINSLNCKKTVAVSGSCGKTSVTAWLTEALFNAGTDPIMIGGGLSNTFTAPDLAGNYRPGNGDLFIFEADESDKSLLNYTPDYALLLNIGTDHYEKNELITMFRSFVKRIKNGIVVSQEVYNLLGEKHFTHLKTVIFDNTPSPDTRWIMKNYSPGKAEFINQINSHSKKYTLNLPMPGRHSGMNALAVFAMIQMLEVKNKNIPECIENFKGVWRRSDPHGVDINGAKIYDDYAHNVEKIISCIKTAKEEAEKVIAIFQPHGFKPLDFMREPLFAELEKELSEKDNFCMLPVYYAGGTTSFSPTSEEVIAHYRKKGRISYHYYSTRAELKEYLNKISTENDIILIMGARDNSLSVFASELSAD